MSLNISFACYKITLSLSSYHTVVVPRKFDECYALCYFAYKDSHYNCCAVSAFSVLFCIKYSHCCMTSELRTMKSHSTMFLLTTAKTTGSLTIAILSTPPPTFKQTPNEGLSSGSYDLTNIKHFPC